MEPRIGLLESIMHPITTFAAVEPPSLPQATGFSVTSETEPGWLNSMLNPRNRPDSLTPVKDAIWRMDGCQTDGHRLFITPRFALNKPPKRVDIYFSDENDYHLSQGLRQVLEPSKLMTVPTRASWRVPLSQHILRGLEHWARSDPSFRQAYTELPFGSYIAVETICADQTAMRMSLVPRYETECEWLSVAELAKMWSRPWITPTVQWPEIIDLSELQLIAQPHEAISIVRIPKWTTVDLDTDLFVFKSVLDDLRYMYHELWRLLTMAPHPNIIALPLAIVTTRSRFGAKPGVCGFVLQHLHHGTLRDLLMRSRHNRRFLNDGSLRSQPTLSMADKFRMAREITSALLHLQAQGTFYAGIKYTNILMRESRWGSIEDGDKEGNRRAGFPTLSPVLIDFDYRTGRYIWTPPEVHHIMHVENLANGSDHGVPDDICARASDLMRTHFPSWRPAKAARKQGYLACWEDQCEPLNGFEAPWLALSPEERDRAQVYMLGRLLWHLFEEVSTVDHCLHFEVLREACELDHSQPFFPVFDEQLDESGYVLTPEPIRRLIRDCTAGAPEWQGKMSPLVYRQGRLWAAACLSEDGVRSCSPQQHESEREAQDALCSWWVDELHEAEQFILARKQHTVSVRETGKQGCTHGLLASMTSRPLLQDVMQALEQEEAAMMSASTGEV
ncbi:hypothetical protein B0H66DRAFT_566723 [Apodospora peruviana]|uniref:Protein kinase domain-containing protein n=1 Tax=Apodospora peruviana TaxID=516989 RepID=A0AAE0LZN7_9PEZI|nr:hypothetical protein B0H66DRAFT_571298 [Apodospora peruviana]KAK3313682.1 hypothetical protein B0H66DRAFT_566723 [Apodospora peruviana]